VRIECAHLVSREFSVEIGVEFRAPLVAAHDSTLLQFLRKNVA
jgi:hypothetical protein